MTIKVKADLVDTIRNAYGFLNPIIEIPEDGIEGNTFIVIQDGQKYIIKLHSDNQRAEALAHFQHQLHVTGLPVPAVIPARTGDLTAKSNGCSVMMCEFVNGQPIGWGETSKTLSDALTSNVANIVARMHIAAHAMNVDSKLDHPLSVSHVLSDLGDNHLGQDLASVRQTMIHSDLTRENIFLNKPRDSVKAIIDFGDAHYDYITYDIAILLTQVYVTKTWGIDFDGVKNFLTAYSQFNVLKPIELKTILPLMKLRNRALLYEIDLQLHEDEADHGTLNSIKQSLGVKLGLLDKNGDKLERLILSV